MFVNFLIIKTETRRKIIWRKKDLFWLTVSKVQVHGQMAWGKSEHHSGVSTGKWRLLTSWQPGGKEKTRRGWRHMPQVHDPADLLPPAIPTSFSFHLWLGTKCLAHEPGRENASYPKHNSNCIWCIYMITLWSQHMKKSRLSTDNIHEEEEIGVPRKVSQKPRYLRPWFGTILVQ